MNPDTLAYLTLSELGARIHSGELSPVALVEALLERIRRLDGALHSFIALTPERALAEARAAEAALKAGRDLGPLHGIPYAAKDLYDVKGLPTTAGTRLLNNNIAREDCAVVRRLAQAGMVLLGKTYTVQFAFGGVGINHDQGTPHNPWSQVPHAPGGSSSGTGVAVASGMVPMALGSDTGGSVRIPAALNGIVGLKTTVGRISRAGVYPLSWTLDSVGPLTRSVEDAALVYSALCGPDAADETTLGIPPHDVLRGLKDGARHMRVAFCETMLFDEADPEVEKSVREAGKVFSRLGAQVFSLEVPEIKEIYGLKRRDLMIAAEALAVNGHLVEQNFDQLDPVVAHRMRPGKEMSATDYFTLLRDWQRLRASVSHTLRDVDVLLAPTCRIPPKPLSEIDKNLDTYGAHNWAYLRNTAAGNNLNLCAVSLPCGFTHSGLPIGLMLYAKAFQEDRALRAAWAYEQATDWHRRHPDLSWVQ